MVRWAQLTAGIAAGSALVIAIVLVLSIIGGLA